MKERLGREVVAMRIAREIQPGEVVNLGVGLGSLVANFFPRGAGIVMHAESGVYGFGDVLTVDQEALFDYHLVNAGGQFVARLPGMCFSDIGDAFDAVHIGRVTTAVLGAYQISAKGDLANWTKGSEGTWGSTGGAMDMVLARRVIVGMEHTTRTNEPKILNKCTYALTGKECVDLVVTDLAVIEVTKEGLLLREFAPGWTVEEVCALTEPRMIISPDVKKIEL